MCNSQQIVEEYYTIHFQSYHLIFVQSADCLFVQSDFRANRALRFLGFTERVSYTRLEQVVRLINQNEVKIFLFEFEF